MPITGAGVTLIAEGTAPRYVAASSASALTFEKLQTEMGDGPCLEAFRSGEAVAVPDIREEHRFPGFASRAERMGLKAVFTFPLRHGEEQLGALDLYRDEPGALDDPTMIVAQTLADVASAYVVNAQARADLRDSADQFRESSLHDALTGLPNRILFNQRLEHAAMRARRSGKKMAILFVDMDRFKEVNDTLGHSVGDLLLAAIADRLADSLRPGDTLARMSGDEFVILCEDLEDAAIGGGSGRSDRHLPRRSVHDRGPTSSVMSASVGIAFSGRGADVPERILQDADAAMYQAKSSGGAHHQIIDLREQDVAQTRVGMMHDLRGALDRDELRTVYQPIVRTARRSRDRRRGAPSLGRSDPRPGPAGDDRLDRRAGRPDRRHRTMGAGTGVPRPPALAGLAPSRAADARREHLSDAAHVAGLHDQPRRHPGRDRCRSSMLSLEVTESVLVQDDDRALVILNDIKELGVSIALDDFGTGYSSLSYLRRFPADVVKIDTGFVADLADPITFAITAAVVDLAHVLGMTVVAEGVETAQQHAQVAALGCEGSQGFFFARPMSSDAFADLLRADAEAGELRLPAVVGA